MAKSENLFLSTRQLTQAKEDHLTEFVCACLRTDEFVLREYIRILTEGRKDLAHLQHTQFKAISTQNEYAGTTCRPDVLFQFQDGFQLLCEHKIDSDETMGEESSNAVGQIERYLKLPIDAVAYIRSSWKPPKPSVISNDKYLKPKTGSHFLWADFYPAFKAGKSLIARWLTEAFEKFGYTPASPEIGDLFDPNEATAKSNRHNLAKLLKPVRDRIADLGWHVGAGSICQLYLDSKNFPVRQILINPYSNAGRNLQIRLTPKHPDKFEAIHEAVEHLTTRILKGALVCRNRVKRTNGLQDVIDVQIGFAHLLETFDEKKDLAQKLFDFITPIIEIASKEISK
jgi:hypothetical protein